MSFLSLSSFSSFLSFPLLSFFTPLCFLLIVNVVLLFCFVYVLWYMLRD